MYDMHMHASTWMCAKPTHACMNARTPLSTHLTFHKSRTIITQFLISVLVW